MNPVKIGEQIASLRKIKSLTQSELGERLGVSFQAVSKWERGESLPDAAILVELADVLETTVDSILRGGEKAAEFKGKLAAKDVREGISCLERMGRLLGRQNIIYRYAVDGIGTGMNSDIQAMLDDEYLRECLVCEAIVQNIIQGYYFDLTEVKGVFKYEKWYKVICGYASKYGIA